MKAANLNGKKIAFIGYGLENQALLAWLKKKKIKAAYTILDARPQPDKWFKNIAWYSGPAYLKNLADFDIVFRSPGAPLFLTEIKRAQKKGVIISSAMNFFLKAAPTKNIIGVTGSKGKGTTASLITTILKTDQRSVYLGGNIGVAPFSFIDRLNQNSWVVLELSSFQLEDFKRSPRYAVLTNLFKEHLEPADPLNPNYHKSFSGYIKAKLQIATHPQNKYFFVPEKLRKQVSKYQLNGKKYYFTSCDYPSKLAGEFNKENVAAATAVAKHLKISEAVIKTAVANFQGLPHRLELIALKKGVRYYDNSFSTTPESTMADLESFPDAIIMLGGADKGADFSNLAKIVKKQARAVILFQGEASPRLKRALVSSGFPLSKIYPVNSMAKAVSQARRLAKTGDVVLLSTACASFGLFKNYKERGDLFQKYVRALK